MKIKNIMYIVAISMMSCILDGSAALDEKKREEKKQLAHFDPNEMLLDAAFASYDQYPAHERFKRRRDAVTEAIVLGANPSHINFSHHNKQTNLLEYALIQPDIDLFLILLGLIKTKNDFIEYEVNVKRGRILLDALQYNNASVEDKLDEKQKKLLLMILIQNGLDINHIFPDDRTLLDRVLDTGSYKWAQLLIKRGARIKPTSLLRFILDRKLFEKIKDKRIVVKDLIQFINQLLDAGVDPNMRTPNDWEPGGETVFEVIDGLKIYANNRGLAHVVGVYQQIRDAIEEYQKKHAAQAVEVARAIEQAERGGAAQVQQGAVHVPQGLLASMLAYFSRGIGQTAAPARPAQAASQGGAATSQQAPPK